MPHPKVVHCKRAPYDVYIGRPGPWGNPYPLSAGVSREECLEQYRAYLERNPQIARAAIHELAGKVLGCWCAPKLCHGEVLMEIIEGDPNDYAQLRGDTYHQIGGK